MRIPDRQYFTNLVTTMMQQLDVNEAVAAGDIKSVRDLYFRFNAKIGIKLLGMSSETVGTIAIFGSAHSHDFGHRTSLYEVSKGALNRDLLGCSDGGLSLVLEIATMAIIAEMCDIIWKW